MKCSDELDDINFDQPRWVTKDQSGPCFFFFLQMGVWTEDEVLAPSFSP